MENQWNEENNLLYPCEVVFHEIILDEFDRIIAVNDLCFFRVRD